MSQNDYIDVDDVKAKCVGDKSEMLVTDLAVFVNKILILLITL